MLGPAVNDEGKQQVAGNEGPSRVTACPMLPAAGIELTANSMESHRGRRDADFYRAALEYGQSLWLQEKPAQAILQLNKAWSAELVGDEEVLQAWPSPYRALVWMLDHAPTDRFLGNPVRHFQHLATRVRGEMAELRSWRAWACFHLSRKCLPPDEHPPDQLQIEREALEIPGVDEVEAGLRQHGWAGEADLFREVLTEREIE